MAERFQKTDLWHSSLAPREADDESEEREVLRGALLQMRENVGQLVSLISADCAELTVHDLSHLDALWDIADTIAGSDYQLTPAEAFVFGAAVLVHDAGLTAASYPDGLESLKDNPSWSDFAYMALTRAGYQNPSPEQIRNPPKDVLPAVRFNVLRAAHAARAENIVLETWTMPGRSEQLYLLENSTLRNGYASSIGRVAASHHWNIDRLIDDLRPDVGAAPSLPSEWTVNERKIACLLRCADAAHIDKRRAPALLYSLVRPLKPSDDHWNFQNRLSAPMVNGDSLIYSSGSPFELKDAPAWWLCYDTIQLIDRELRSCNSLLEDTGIPGFAAKRVSGAESPRLLQKHIGTLGWTPVDAQIRVTDPGHLAETLGGRNLYGDNIFVPFRELLQNGADAVRARRQLERRQENWGLIAVRTDHRDGQLWLHVDDTGLGMSERVLTGPLLDFGKSLWTSSLLREEFPGLVGLGLHQIGKFGIGFFSSSCSGTE